MTENKIVSDFIYEVIKSMRTDETMTSESKKLLERHLRAFDLNSEKNTAKGVVVIAINPNGSVVAEGLDFDNSCPGGMRIDESQHRRALQAMKIDFAKNHLNHFMVEKIDTHFASDFWEHATNNGYKVEVIKVGYPREEE